MRTSLIFFLIFSCDSVMGMLPVRPVRLGNETVSEWVQICGEDGELQIMFLQDPKIWHLA